MAFPINRKRIAARIAGREEAEALISCIDHNYLASPDCMEAIVEEFEKYTNRNKPQTPATPEPIARLGATIIPFGQHLGRTFDQTPLEYLDWLCREQEGFYKTLREYLKHPELEGRRRAAGR